MLVAAVGNGDEAPREPWPYASYPAALPHVIGVGALDATGDVPRFSNRDPVFNDIAAPGAGIFSTFPRAITASGRAAPTRASPTAGRTTTATRRNVVRRAAGLRRGRGAARRSPVADEQPGRVRSSSTPPTTSARRRAARSARCCATRSRGWGRLDVAKAVAALAGPAARRPTATRRTTTPARRRARSGASSASSRRRSTTRTTRSTSTASPCRPRADTAQRRGRLAAARSRA